MQTRSKIALAAGGVLGAVIVIPAARSGGGHASPKSTSEIAHLTHHHSAGDTVTFVVTGSNAEVTYGPAGSSHQAKPPLHVTNTIPKHRPAYYSISAQLQGGGHVSAKIEVNGKVVSHSTADGGYNIAMAEIVENPITGGWTDAN